MSLERFYPKTFKDKFGICLSIIWTLIGLFFIAIIFGASTGMLKFIISLIILDCIVGAIVLTWHKIEKDTL